METLNLSEVFKDVSYLSHLILDVSDRKGIEKVVRSADYDIKKVVVSIQLNGIEIRSEPLETILADWVERLYSQRTEDCAKIKERVEYLKTEEGLKEKARELAKEMCYEMAQKFEWE